MQTAAARSCKHFTELTSEGAWLHSPRDKTSPLNL
jgi:hypothetical protein